MPHQVKKRPYKKAGKPDPVKAQQFERVIGGQSGEMTFMMQYHFHGLFP
ncbi:manganese catalase family protein [Lederbergia sp. NSJ-179]|nr:manganese catalase family protein [Lederbergia sp. NSJ-179]MCJ7841598.1 manganese catalase family protein [Lederbergia sp. NSJ-179]